MRRSRLSENIKVSKDAWSIDTARDYIIGVAAERGFDGDKYSLLTEDVLIKLLHILQTSYEVMLSVGVEDVPTPNVAAIERETKFLDSVIWGFIVNIFECAERIQVRGRLDEKERATQED